MLHVTYIQVQTITLYMFKMGMRNGIRWWINFFIALRHTYHWVYSVLTIKIMVMSIMITCYKVLDLHVKQSSSALKELEILYLFPLLDSSIFINYCSCSVWHQYILVGPLKSIKLFKDKEYLTTNLFPGPGPGMVLKHSSCVNIIIRACPHSAVKFKQMYILILTGPVLQASAPISNHLSIMARHTLATLAHFRHLTKVTIQIHGM